MKGLTFIKILRFAIKSFLIGLIVLSFLLVAALFYYSHQELAYKIISFYGRLDKLEEFKSVYFTIPRFLGARYFSIILCIVSLVTGFKLEYFTTLIQTKLLSLITSIKAFHKSLWLPWFSLSKTEKYSFYFVLSVTILVKLYFLPRYFFHIDELTSYLFFIKRGLSVILSYYPNPNNHILYAIIVWLFKPFISNPVYLIKIPTLIISVFTSILFFLFMKRHFNAGLSILGMLLFSFCGHILNYSLFGRGYLLMTFFVMIATYVVIEFLTGKNEKYQWHIYAMASILGFYTMIIYFYPFVSLVTVLFFHILYHKKYENLKSFFYYNCLIVLGVLLLYTPVFIVSGFSALASNAWILRTDVADFLTNILLYTEEAFSHILDFNYYAAWIGVFILLSSLLLFWKTKRYDWFWIMLAFYFIPVAILFIQQIKPYSRIWTYLIFPTIICLIVILEFSFNAISKNRFIKNGLMILLGIAATIYTIDNSIKNTSPERTLLYADVDRITKYVVKESTGKIYTNENSYNLYIRYNSDLIGKNIVPEMGVKVEPQKFNYVLLFPGTSFPEGINKENFILKEKNAYIEVYKLKG